MIYRFFLRIFRKQALYHLIIPLLGGIVVEVVYSLINGITYYNIPNHLFSGPVIVLYIGIFVTYVLVVGIRINLETNIGLAQIELNVLANKLASANSLFAVATLRYSEWFDPAVQVYLATILKEKLTNTSFQYERILLLESPSARKELNSDYLDGYQAKCLIAIHKKHGINLYFIEWPQILAILNKLTLQEKVHVGFCPKFMMQLPVKLKNWLNEKWLVHEISRLRVRNVAVGVIKTNSGSNIAFRFSKCDKIVNVRFEPPEREQACVKFVDHIKKEIYEHGATSVKPDFDFTEYYKI